MGSLGFLTDKRRLNVAITRPKHFLFVVGSARNLVKDEVWHSFVLNCIENEYKQKEGGSFFTVKDKNFRANSVKQILINQTF